MEKWTLNEEVFSLLQMGIFLLAMLVLFECIFAALLGGIN